MKRLRRWRETDGDEVSTGDDQAGSPQPREGCRCYQEEVGAMEGLRAGNNQLWLGIYQISLGPRGAEGGGQKTLVEEPALGPGNEAGGPGSL